MSNIWALPRKIRGNYYRLKRLLNENLFVSIPSYKKTDVKEREVFYKDKIDSIIRNASNHASPFPTPTERFKNYEYGISVTDVSSDVLKQREGDRVIYYRGILPGYAPYFKELYATGVLQSLAEAGRVAKITPTNFYTDDYPMILQVETLHVVNPVFWSFSMIRECVINLLLIDSVLEKFGYGVIDGHPFNTAFKDGHPVMFDIGSFVKRKECQFAGELIHYPLSTLLMLSINRSHFARHNIAVMNTPVRAATAKGISIEKQALYKVFFDYHKRHSSRGYNAILSEVFREKRIKPEYVDILFGKRLAIETIPGEAPNLVNRSTPPADQFTRIIQVIRDFSPQASSALDLAGDEGEVSYLLSKTGRFTSVISLDPDEDVIESGIARFRNEGISFYHVNPFFPFGEREPFVASVRSDVVLALGITHKLILTQQYKIHAVLSIIDMYTKRHVYIDFYPFGEGDSGNAQNLPSWYTEEWFEEKFKTFFNLLRREVLQTVDSHGEEKPLRILYVGEKLSI